jgi:hypothetical protein
MADEPTTGDATRVEPEVDDVLHVEPQVLPGAPLGGELDEWGEQEDAVAFVRIAGFPTEDEAAQVVRFLLEAGIGATVAPDDTRSQSDPEGVWGVHVLPVDRRRAAERLGLVDVEERPGHSPEEPIQVERGGIPWKVVLPIFVVALIVVPLAAGFLTYFVMSR